MNGLGPFAEPIAWFRLYWAAWALLLAVIARAFWVRGRDRDVRGSDPGHRHLISSVRVRRTGTRAAADITGGRSFVPPGVDARPPVPPLIPLLLVID